jgi:hypothetical protein
LWIGDRGDKLVRHTCVRAQMAAKGGSMQRERQRRIVRMPSPAMTVACIALAVALSGASYAAVALPRNSVGTAQLKRNAVTSPKVRDNAIRGVDVNEATLGIVPAANTANTASTANSASTANTAANATNAANAANSDRLDNLDSADFLRANGKAADANLLDGLDSTAFSQFLYASVRDTGTLFGSRGATAAARTSTGRYTVTFNRSLSTCIAVGSQHYRTGSGGISVGISGSTQVTVITSVGTADTDRDFHVVVLC